MLRKINNSWQAARGDILRKEVEDAMLKLERMGTEINLHACITMADAYRILLDNYGPISNMSTQGQKLTATMFSKKAKGRFDFNIGQGYGLFLLGAYVEAHALPGENALFVKKILHDMIHVALKTKADFKRIKKDGQFSHVTSNNRLISERDFQDLPIKNVRITAFKVVRPLHVFGKSYWNKSKINRNLFLQKLLVGKAPLWFVFWIIHMLPVAIMTAGTVTSYDHSVSLAGVIYIPYFIFSAYLVIKTAKGKEQNSDKPYNDAFFHQAAILIVVLQALSLIGRLFLAL